MERLAAQGGATEGHSHRVRHSWLDVGSMAQTAASGGTVVDTSDVANLTVTAELINANLDFTPVPYDGQALGVEVRVRPGASNGSYTALSPRRVLAAAPHALFTLARSPGMDPHACSTMSGSMPPFRMSWKGRRRFRREVSGWTGVGCLGSDRRVDGANVPSCTASPASPAFWAPRCERLTSESEGTWRGNIGHWRWPHSQLLDWT